MLKVIIEREGLTHPTKLKDILEDRQAIVEFSKDTEAVGEKK